MSIPYKYQKLLGEGGFGIAYLVIHEEHGEVVFKKLETTSASWRMKFQNESAIHERLSHPNIVKYFGVHSVPETCGIFLEYMKHGTVVDFIREFSIPWQWKTLIMYDVAQAMSYLHNQHQPSIIHGDLKPSNILIDGQYRAKVSDFGLACLQRMVHNSTDRSPRGTLPYIAPEYLEDNRKQKTVKFDVYGFGISVWEIFSEKRHDRDFEVARTIQQFVIGGQRPLLSDIKYKHTLPDQILKMMEKCWHRRALKRPAFEEIVNVLWNELSPIYETLQVPEKNENSSSSSSIQLNVKSFSSGGELHRCNSEATGS